MRTKSLVLIIIALGCGLVASIGISEVLKQKPAADGAVEMESILVAAIDIDIGKKLDAANVKIEEWPKGKVPEGAMNALDQAQDHFTRTRLYAGEPILTAKLMDSNDPSAAPKIPDGYMVIPVRVELDTVIGLIQPGDLVDVMVFLRQGPDIPRTGSYTILRMARVFAVNSQTDRTTDDKGQEIAARTVSLMVKPKQGEKLTLATEMGKIRLALRRPTDVIPDEEEIDKDLPAIFREGDVIAMDKPEEKKEEPQPVLPIAQPLPVLPPVVHVQPQPLAPPAPVWTMQLMTPSDVRKFDWSNAKELPQESSLGGAAPLPPISEPIPAVPAASETEVETPAEPTSDFSSDEPVATE